MSQRDWSDVRHVAEDIAAGDRSAFNLQRRPQLTWSRAREVIKQLERQGLISVSGDLVEPTAAFMPWLRELREGRGCLKTTPNVGQTPVVSEAKTEQPREQTAQPDPSGGEQSAEITGRPRATPVRIRKPYFCKLGWDRVRELAGRIVETLASYGPQTKRELVNRLHAHRYPEFPRAWDYLLQRGVIAILDGKVTLIDESASEGLPSPYPPPPPPKKKRRKRPRSEWFERLYQRAQESDLTIGDLIDQDRVREIDEPRAGLWDPSQP